MIKDNNPRFESLLNSSFSCLSFWCVAISKDDNNLIVKNYKASKILKMFNVTKYKDIK